MSETIEGLAASDEVVPPPAGVERWFTADQLDDVTRALDDRERFWRDAGATIAWETPPQTTFSGTIDDQHWFADGRLNATVSCLDRHARSHPDAVAYRYLREDGHREHVTYAELLARVGRLGNALRADGVRRGDRVVIYMPLTVEGVVAMLACARIGAVHSVVYAGLGSGALRDRIVDAGAAVLLVADCTFRRGKRVDLKTIVDDAVRDLPAVRRVVVWRRTSSTMLDAREVDWEPYVDQQPPACEPEIVGAEDPLFILYTSGTTGKPKGVVMNHGGYLVGAATQLRRTTGVAPDEEYWCTSDIGWIVGHTMMVYGALANRYRIVMREGSPDWPTPDAVYATIAELGVSTLYTAPTLARMLMRGGCDLLGQHDLSSLRVVFCAGEPLNPEAWRFLFRTVGRGRVAVCNQWWQTELAAPAIGYYPSTPVRPDRSGYPLGPLRFRVVDGEGVDVPAGAGGLLVLATPAPFMFARIWGDDARYREYFRDGVYVAGDVATLELDGTITVRGRADDVLNIAGHRIATADVESALVSHAACGEAGVVGIPDEIKGEAIVAFVQLRGGHVDSAELRDALVAHVRRELGPIATPARVEVLPKLPKTRSGKIMRRLLRAQATGAPLGDVTTLED